MITLHKVSNYSDEIEKVDCVKMTEKTATIKAWHGGEHRVLLISSTDKYFKDESQAHNYLMISLMARKAKYENNLSAINKTINSLSSKLLKDDNDEQSK
jgi:hypothetical protein